MYPKWSKEGTTTYRKVAMIKSQQILRNRIATPRGRSGASLRHTRLMEAWLAEARDTGEVLTEGLTAGRHWQGSNSKWPDWLSVEAVQLLVLQATGEAIDQSPVGKWLTSKNLKKKTVYYTQKTGPRRVKIKKHAAMYKITGLHTGPIDRDTLNVV